MAKELIGSSVIWAVCKGITAARLYLKKLINLITGKRQEWIIQLRHQQDNIKVIIILASLISPEYQDILDNNWNYI